MKIIASILCALLSFQMCIGQQKEFIEYVLEHFECRNCNFIALKVAGGDFAGSAVVENDDLYNYFEKMDKFDKVQYKSYVTGLLQSSQPLVLRNATLESNGYFIKVKGLPDRTFKIVKDHKDVDDIASQGCEVFIRYYFLAEELETIKSRSSRTCREFIQSQKEPLRYSRGLLDASKQNSIVSRLFDWQISARIEDISNGLVIGVSPKLRSTVHE